MKITAEQLRLIARNPQAETFADAITVATDKWGIDTKLRMAHWISQWGHETQGFTKLRENLNYAAEVLIVRFPKRISKVDAYRYGRVGQPPFKGNGDHPADQIEIANRIYGGDWGAQHLGNTQSGDGSRYIGRGFPNVTGRENYTRCSKALCGDDTLVYRPEFLEQPKYAAEAGGWFWHDRNLNELADRDDIHGITMKVTGWDGTGDGLAVGFDQRKTRLERALLVL